MDKTNVSAKEMQEGFQNAAEVVKAIGVVLHVLNLNDVVFDRETHQATIYEDRTFWLLLGMAPPFEMGGDGVPSVTLILAVRQEDRPVDKRGQDHLSVSYNPSGWQIEWSRTGGTDHLESLLLQLGMQESGSETNVSFARVEDVITQMGRRIMN